MSRFACLALLAVVSAVPAPARAQYGSTRADRLACTGDALRMCRPHIHDIAALRGCMSAHRERLSPACRAVLERR